MNDKVIEVKTIQDFANMINYGEVSNDLIFFTKYKNTTALSRFSNVKMISDLYSISFKEKPCEFLYGRQEFDFSEASIIYTNPDQLMEFDIPENNGDGWYLVFHPDLLSKSKIDMSKYRFFDYSVNEALHISEKEKEKLDSIVSEINEELFNETDDATIEVILSNLELLLSYSNRFYNRQFKTREQESHTALSRFEEALTILVNVQALELNGQPTVCMIAEELGYSSNYLSDLLRKLTGKTPKELIHNKVIDIAKKLLLTTNDSISEISYKLGFSYPAHFTTFFKKKTGKTPKMYRN